ncbi:uncharacterized protein LOC107029454 isoform X2 [Solanum pennellii]|uniref:Uncharacterized protein LOC107029454 isoform X2 n=1 Tax=Solanum pennellii TaxID=28526 RepID=A0ABM1HJF3_SOLPN|nr:uncharacterized protein LOC107029454 isoform X2 [Solanum pennellii]
MEGTKKTSSSSFTSDLFGSKETSASSSSAIFGSIFPPPSKEVLLLAMKLPASRLHKTSSRVHFIRMKKYSHAILAHRYTTGAKMSIHFLKTIIRALHAQLSTKITVKMILAVRLEETGGKGLFTTRAHHQ